MILSRKVSYVCSADAAYVSPESIEFKGYEDKIKHVMLLEIPPNREAFGLRRNSGKF